MKKIYITLALLFCALSQAQIVNIPDANFKFSLVNEEVADLNGNNIYDSDVDTNNDGEIQVSEAESVIGLLVNNKDISSMIGIETFLNLENLNCSSNLFTSLDISQNTNLSYLKCVGSQLTTLDTSNNLNLLGLNLFHSSSLATLDVSLNFNLVSLDCSFSQIVSLDLSQNYNLRNLDCSFSRIEVLDLSQNPNLENVFCQFTHLSILNIKNGNNNILFNMFAYDNPNLFCIQVDDVAQANNEICVGPIDPYGWCKDSRAHYSEDCSLSSEEFTTEAFSISPNPVKDVLTVNSKDAVDVIKIYSTNGKILKETRESSINISELASGIYFIVVSVEGKTDTKKFIKI